MEPLSTDKIFPITDKLSDLNMEKQSKEKNSS